MKRNDIMGRGSGGLYAYGNKRVSLSIAQKIAQQNIH